jgi:hypothetical protein
MYKIIKKSKEVETGCPNLLRKPVAQGGLFASAVANGHNRDTRVALEGRVLGK